MTNIKSILVDRLSSAEKEIYSEFVKVFPLDGHEPDSFKLESLEGQRLDNDGWNDNWRITITNDSINQNEYRFNLATLLAFAKFGFEKASELNQ